MELKGTFVSWIVSKILTRVIKRKTGMDIAVCANKVVIDDSPHGKDSRMLEVDLDLKIYADKDQVHNFLLRKDIC